MKEEDIKKIMHKSSIETSEDFVDNLMGAIEAEQQAVNASSWWSLRSFLIICAGLFCGMLFVWVKFAGLQGHFLSVFYGIPKTPLFVILTFVFLYYLNNLIRLNEEAAKASFPDLASD